MTSHRQQRWITRNIFWKPGSVHSSTKYSSTKYSSTKYSSTKYSITKYSITKCIILYVANIQLYDFVLPIVKGLGFYCLLYYTSINVFTNPFHIAIYAASVHMTSLSHVSLVLLHAQSACTIVITNLNINRHLCNNKTYYYLLHHKNACKGKHL